MLIACADTCVEEIVIGFEETNTCVEGTDIDVEENLDSAEGIFTGAEETVTDTVTGTEETALRLLVQRKLSLV